MNNKVELNDRYNEIMSQFMMAEHLQLHERVRHNNQLAQNQANYYLALTTTAITGLTLLYMSPQYLATFYIVAPVVTYLLFLIGSLHGLQAVNFHEDAIVFYRRIGRVRRWFYNLDPRVLDYLPFDPTDSQPGFVQGDAALRHIESTPVVLTVVWKIAWVLSLISTFFWARENTSLAGSISVLAWFIFGILFYNFFVRTGRFFTKQLQGKEQKEVQLGQIHFPSVQAVQPRSVTLDTSSKTMMS